MLWEIRFLENNFQVYERRYYEFKNLRGKNPNLYRLNQFSQ